MRVSEFYLTIFTLGSVSCFEEHEERTPSACCLNLFVWCLEAHQKAPSAEKQLRLFRSACDVRVLKTLPVSLWLKLALRDKRVV